jgi:hypothetical protein
MIFIHLFFHLFFEMDIQYFNNIFDLCVIFDLSLLLFIIKINDHELYELRLSHQLFFLIVLSIIGGLFHVGRSVIDIIGNLISMFFFHFNTLLQYFLNLLSLYFVVHLRLSFYVA